MNTLDTRCPWATVVQATGDHWALQELWYRPDGDKDNDSTTNVYAIAFNADGTPALSASFKQSWPDGSVEIPFRKNAAGQAQSSFNMSNNSVFYPDKGQVGPYQAQIDGNSDVVMGLGLPVARHTQYWLIFKFMQGELPAPVPIPVPSGDYVTRAQFAAVTAKLDELYATAMRRQEMIDIAALIPQYFKGQP